jgi:hypothetical protein
VRRPDDAAAVTAMLNDQRETRASMARDRAFALFCDRYASTWCMGNHLFAYPKWEMRVDREWESAANVLQSRGYKL